MELRSVRVPDATVEWGKREKVCRVFLGAPVAASGIIVKDLSISVGWGEPLFGFGRLNRLAGCQISITGRIRKFSGRRHPELSAAGSHTAEFEPIGPGPQPETISGGLRRCLPAVNDPGRSALADREMDTI